MVNILILIILVLIFLMLVGIKNSLTQNTQPKEEINQFIDTNNYTKDIYDEIKELKQKFDVFDEIKTILDDINSTSSKIEDHTASIKTNVDRIDDRLIGMKIESKSTWSQLYDIGQKLEDSNKYLVAISKK